MEKSSRAALRHALEITFSDSASGDGKDQSPRAEAFGEVGVDTVQVGADGPRPLVSGEVRMRSHVFSSESLKAF